MRYAIVGCGTGGPAAALLLKRQGHAVTLFERVPAPGPVGAGVLIQPTGMRVLRQLGLLERALAAGSRIERLYGENHRGRVVLDLGYADLAPGLFGLGLARGALFSALWDAAHADGVEVRTGVEIEGFDERPDGVIVAGEAYDRLIIASGARSGLRPPGAAVRPYPWGALWAVVPSDLSPRCLTQRYRDTRQMFGMLPSGPGALSMFWSLRVDARDAWRAAGLEAWKRQIRALYPEAPLDTLRDPDQIVFAPYFDVVAPRWHTDRVLWIGDAAHAMSPQLGQGANLALMDAAVLATCETFAEWSARRRAHLRFYQLASRLLTPFFQSSLPVLAPLRDLVAGPLHAWGWYRRQMLESLAGTKTGVFSRLQLEDLGAAPDQGTG